MGQLYISAYMHNYMNLTFIILKSMFILKGSYHLIYIVSVSSYEYTVKTLVNDIHIHSTGYLLRFVSLL